MSALRVGILGCGGIGERHAKAVQATASGLLTLTGCSSRDVATATTFAARHEITAYPSLERMLEHIDLLVIATPPNAHREAAERAAQAGVHLLIEKPIALAINDALAIEEAVIASGVTASVGFMYRFGDFMRLWQSTETGKRASSQPISIATAPMRLGGLMRRNQAGK